MDNFVTIKGFEETHLINKKTFEIYSVLKKKILKGSINKRL